MRRKKKSRIFRIARLGQASTICSRKLSVRFMNLWCLIRKSIRKQPHESEIIPTTSKPQNRTQNTINFISNITTGTQTATFSISYADSIKRRMNYWPVPMHETSILGWFTIPNPNPKPGRDNWNGTGLAQIMNTIRSPAIGWFMPSCAGNVAVSLPTLSLVVYV